MQNENNNNSNKFSINLPQPVSFVLWQLNKAGYEAYVVGGAVRDLLVNRNLNDWDFTSNATPEQIQAVFPESFYDNQFGTVGLAYEHITMLMQANNWIMDNDQDQKEIWEDQVLEITTFRTDISYSDNRRPDRVEWGKNLVEDLERRDFTINAMALEVENIENELAYIRSKPNHNLEVKLIDPFYGKKDLDDKLIRAVGDPNKRFREDALRMMRAVRFGAQLGFVIENETLLAIKELANLINKISFERIRDELLKILGSEYPTDGIKLLDTLNILELIIPELTLLKGVRQVGHHKLDVWNHSLESLKSCPSYDPIVRLATLLHDIGKPRTFREGGPRGVTFHGHEVVGANMAKIIGQRLRLSNKELDRLYILVRWHMFHYQEDMTDAAIRRLMKNIGLDNINDIIMLRIGDRLGSGAKESSWRLRELQRRIGEQLYQPMSVKDLKVDGNTVMQVLDIPPGKRIGEILNILFEEVMDNPNKNEVEYLVERIKELGK